MKKLLLLGFGLTLTAATMSAKAQDSTSPIQIGIKAGGNYMHGGTYVTSADEYTSKFMPGFSAGLFLNIPLGGGFSLMPEGTYTQKNSKLDETVSGTEFEVKTRAGYVEVPFMLKYRIDHAFHFVIGPQVSFLTGQRTQNFANGTLTSTNTDQDNFRKSIPGAVAGFGYRVTPHLSLDLRYSMDFKPIVDDDQNQDEAKIKGFGLSFGWAF
jgi:hypothetical protein